MGMRDAAGSSGGMLQAAVAGCCPASQAPQDTRCRCSATAASPAQARLKHLPACRWCGAHSPSKQPLLRLILRDCRPPAPLSPLLLRHSSQVTLAFCSGAFCGEAKDSVRTSLRSPGEQNPCRVPRSQRSTSP